MSPRFGLCLFIALLTFADSVSAAVLEAGGDMSVELSERGRVSSVSIGATRLPMKGTGGFAIADFKNQPPPVNLVPNPGFEQGANGWRLAKGQTLDTAIAHSGKCSARLEVPGPGPGESNLEVFVPVKPNTRYRVGMWLRRERVGVCGAYSSERDDQGKLSGKRTQVGFSIPKRDGEWLPLAWEITTEPKTTRLSLRANIYRSTGTLWLDDYFVEEVSEGVFEAVEGETKRTTDGMMLTATLPKRGLQLDAVFRPGRDCLRVDGTIRDTTGQDRAVGVKFALPLDVAGWTWHHDAEERETIQPGPAYRRTYKCQTGMGVCSIYPWSALSGPQAGLSLALPVSQGPRVFVLQHDQTRPETSLTFFFGLAKDAGNHPSRAAFSLVLYPHDPAWGMRSAMATYYRLFPESFLKRPTFEGYLNYANAERFDPAKHQLVVYSRDALDDASDFGEGYRFLWHLHGCYDFRQVPSDDPQRPSDEKVFSLLQEMVATETAQSRYYTPTAETSKKIVFGADGGISYIGDTRYWRAHEGYNHTDKPGWGLNFRVNEDPGISLSLAEMSRRKAEADAQRPGRRGWDATFTADAIEGYFANSSGPDYRREHFRTTLVPLTFGYENLRPCMPNTIWDFHKKAWWPLTGQYKIATYGNANGYEQFFTMPFVDVPMTEGNWDPQHQGRLDRFMRAVNYRKIWRYWHAWDKAGGYGDRDEANVRAHFRGGLAYAIYPAVACVQSATGDLEPHRALYRQYVPAIEELSVAGWEPVSYATATEGVIVERFGGFDRGELHFTLRNYADRPVETVLAPDWKSLGIPSDAELVALDIVPRAPQLTPLPRAGLPVAIEANGSRAFWVGTREQAAQHGFRLAAATLGKLERLFATEMDQRATTAWKKALATARGGTRAKGKQALQLSQQLQQQATALAKELTTRSPVDLAKLLFRVRAEASLAPVALLNLEVEAPRVVADAIAGQAAVVTWKPDRGTALRVVSPWPEIAGKSAMEGHQARLWVPADPPRRLLPYLLMVGDGTFTVAMPVDVQVGPPFVVKLSPQAVLRGQESRLDLSVVNRLDQSGQIEIALTAPPKVKFTPAKMSLELAARATAQQPVTITLDKHVPIGDLRITHTITSTDPRFLMKGPIFLSVEGEKNPP